MLIKAKAWVPEDDSKSNQSYQECFLQWQVGDNGTQPEALGLGDWDSDDVGRLLRGRGKKSSI